MGRDIIIEGLWFRWMVGSLVLSYTFCSFQISDFHFGHLT